MKPAGHHDVPLGVECALPALPAPRRSRLARLWRWLAQLSG